jgi:homoserine kinase type II
MIKDHVIQEVLRLWGLQLRKIREDILIAGNPDQWLFRTVIDWEFLRYKPEIYDIAMTIGCLGMEKPQSLTGDLVFEFVKRFRESGLIAERSWSYLFEFVLALRFAWLSGLLKRSDPEMIELEAVYIQLLLDNREIFIRSWGI